MGSVVMLLPQRVRYFMLLPLFGAVVDGCGGGGDLDEVAFDGGVCGCAFGRGWAYWPFGAAGEAEAAVGGLFGHVTVPATNGCVPSICSSQRL
jgi:hypothetical protein